MQKKTFRIVTNKQGFTLLEVIIALALVSIVGIVAIHQVGQSQIQLAQTKWDEDIYYEARKVFVKTVTQEEYSLKQGSLTPRFPHIEYSSSLETLPHTSLQKFTMVFRDNQKNRDSQFSIWQFLP